MYVGNSFYYYNDSMHSKVIGLNSAADPQKPQPLPQHLDHHQRIGFQLA